MDDSGGCTTIQPSGGLSQSDDPLARFARAGDSLLCLTRRTTLWMNKPSTALSMLFFYSSLSYSILFWSNHKKMPVPVIE